MANNKRQLLPPKPLLLLLLLVAVLSFYYFTILTIARLHYQSGSKGLKEDKYSNALRSLDSGIYTLYRYLPGLHIVYKNDLMRSYTLLGETHFQMGARSKSLVAFVKALDQSHSYYKQATEINPLDIVATEGLARATAALERTALILNTDKTYNALPIFQQALKIRPNGIQLHFFFLRYLYERGYHDHLRQTAAHLVEIYPYSFRKLKDKPYFDVRLRNLIHTRLLDTLHHQQFPKGRYETLAEIAELDGDLVLAADYYEKSLGIDVLKNNYYHYIRMGELRLRQGESETASGQFRKALHSKFNKGKSFRSIWYSHKRHKMYQEFVSFCDLLSEDKTLSEAIFYYKAEAFVKMEQNGFALYNLSKIEKGSYAAQSYYLKARIAQGEKDYDAMELATQRTTVLEPDNPQYHYYFAKALSAQKKYYQAEQAVTKALELALKSQPYMLSHRGWMRWYQNNLQGAMEDWEEAIKLRPDNPRFYYFNALANERIKNYQAALKDLRHAIRLKPDEKQYRERYKKIRKLSSP